MKKIITLFLAVTVLLSLAACSQSPAENTDTQEDPTEVTPTEWGVEDMLYAFNAEEGAGFSIHFPDTLGEPRYTGMIGKQADGSLVLVDRQHQTVSPQVNSLSEVFPAYFEQAKQILSGYYETRAEDYRFEIAEQSQVRINGYDMIVYSGTHYYTFEQVPVQCNWVGYVTQLSANDAYVYWMVLDNAANVASNADIAQSAKNMAISLLG